MVSYHAVKLGDKNRDSGDMMYLVVGEQDLANYLKFAITQSIWHESPWHIMLMNLKLRQNLQAPKVAVEEKGTNDFCQSIQKKR